jgi:uncharacterized membrane protein SirB2
MSEKTKLEISGFVNGPWINRFLMGVIIYFVQGFYSDSKKTTEEMRQMRTDVEVIKKEVQFLTDYNVNPK